MDSIVEDFRNQINGKITEFAGNLQPPTLQEAVHHGSTGGKRMRPVLTMMSCGAAGGHPLDALEAAVAIEFLHSSSLVHDDIMDGSDLRRGRLTVHRLFGLSTAILTGDTLTAIAYRALHSSRASYSPRVQTLFSNAFVETCEGQGLDVTSQESDTSERHALMVKKKTARLIATAAAIGGVIGGGTDEEVEALTGFGLHIGIAYQAQDDILDATASEARTGKSTGLDRRNGRHTFLTSRVVNVRSVVEDYTDRAFDCLDALPPTGYRDQLRILASSLVGGSR